MRRELKRHLMSKWIWVTEVSDLELFRKDRKIFGFVIQDSASHATFPDYLDLIAFQFFLHLVLVDPKGNLKSLFIPKFAPYPMFMR